MSSETYPLVDCQGLGGAWTLGCVQTGRLDLRYRVSIGAFGDDAVARNRSLLGDDWYQDAGSHPDEWTPAVAAVLCGTPPCSGFSNLNTRNSRGPGAEINRCMWSLIDYAGRCYGHDGQLGPEIVSLESVQGAYKQGRNLMQALRDQLEGLTSQEYELHHVLMSGSTVGAAQIRRRYYMVLSRVPFGVDPPRRSDLPEGRPTTYYDAIGDLQGLTVGSASQPYLYGPVGEFSRRLRGDAVTSHVTAGGALGGYVREACLAGWEPGTFLSEALDALDIHPPALERQRRPGKLRRGDSSYVGLNWPLRVPPAKPAYVLTGSCARDYAHWAEPRFLTIRECARLMGYPDAWRLPEAVTTASAQIGKCCPVDSGRWIAGWFVRALDGEPGRAGEEIEPGEHLYNFTNLYKSWFS